MYVRGPYPGLTMRVSENLRDRDGMDNAVISYQWLGDDIEIEGATNSTYTVAESDLGKTLKVRVSFADDRGHEETKTSPATLVVRLRYQAPRGKPIIRGTREVGQTLRADVSGITDGNGLTNATFTYQWRNTSLAFRGFSKDTSEYTLLPEDEGRTGIWLRLSYTDDAGHKEVVYNDSIEVVKARSGTGAPAIVGTARVGEILTADTSSISDSHGMDNATFSYQWLTDYAEIQYATASTYTLDASDIDSNIRVRVSFTDDAGNDETLISTATAAVAARVPSAPRSLEVELN